MQYRNKLKELGITADKSGHYLCPQCSHTRKKSKDPCLSVTFGHESVLYKCHNGCGFEGIVSYRSKNIRQVKTYKKPQEPKKVTNKEKIYKFFEDRKISKETLDFFKTEYNGTEIIFPYYKDGELVNVKYRNAQKKFRQEFDSEKTFYGMDLVPKNAKELIITEGEIDVFSFYEIGIKNVVSVPQGASEEKLECIDNCYDWLQSFNTFVIAVDNDRMGDKLKHNLLNRLEKHKCKIINFERWKDANEVLCDNDGGSEKLKELTEMAKEPESDTIINYYDKWDEIHNFYTNGYTTGYSTGWYDLDNIFTIKKGYLMIVTGYPSRGKSYFVDNLLLNLSENSGLKHLMASFESADDIHFADLCTMRNKKLFKESTGWESTEYAQTYEFIANHFYRLKIDKQWSVNDIIKEAHYAVKRYGIDTLLIDPYNRLKNDYKDREDKYIGDMLAKLSMTAKQLNIFIVFIAHPKKPDSEKAPNLYSISGSSDWYNMADYGITIHRDRGNNGKLENKCQVLIQKVKNKHIGDPRGGEIKLFLNYKTHRLEKYFDTGNYKSDDD